jgi:type II secretory pathway pseudopilin PulG
MAISSQGTRTGIQVGLGIVILVLAYFLYRSITEPYERIERQQRITEQTRERMSNIRTALIDYERDSTSYPDSLNILVQHIQSDSILATRQDSVFGGPLNLDSLLFSPRSGNPFQYTVSDTGRVETYLLEDPDTDDQIGTLSGDPTETNVASWE